MVEKIKISGLDFFYSEEQVLDSVDLAIPSNKIVSLIGPSGCGKSTLLRCLNRMNDLVPGSKVKGEIFYDGKDLYSEDVVSIRKKIGMVFQKPNPFPMSIQDNVSYGLKVQGEKDKGRIQRVVKETLEKVDLLREVESRLDSSAFGLSGGQQQRLCIARCLAISPDVILLDEPCSALDPISTAKIEELLLKLKEDYTVVIVTHNLAQAKRISDYTCYMLDGKTVEFSRTSELFSSPKHKLTRDYISGKFG